jgi:hypothetical protein
MIEPCFKPPDDEKTVMLFDGGSWGEWHDRYGGPSGWVVQADGSVLVGPNDAVTNREFGDFQLHLEFFCPEVPGRTGQGRANSGVYLHGSYEIQVLDSFGDAPLSDGCGALYSLAPPLVNASGPPDTWQTYDVTFRAPRFDAENRVAEPPRVTVLHNGLTIHNNLVIPSVTPGGVDSQMRARGPLLLQDHGDPVRYRNVWVRHLD